MSHHVSRRQFLQLSANAVAMATLSQATSKLLAADPPARTIVAAHPWVYAATMENYDITPALDAIFADMRYAGLDAIELMHTALYPDDAAPRIKELSQKHQLPVLGTSFGAAMWDKSQHSKILEDAERVVTRLAALGGRTLGVSVGDAGQKKTAQQLDDQADLLEKVITLCNANDVVLNLHNHQYEVRDGQYDLKGTLQRIPDVKLGPDLDWLVQADVDPVAFLLEHGERIVFLHLRDQKRDKTWVEAMGEGDMDYDAIAQALAKIRFSGDVVIELAHPRGMKLTRPLRESLKLSREFVRRKLGY